MVGLQVFTQSIQLKLKDNCSSTEKHTVKLAFFHPKEGQFGDVIQFRVTVTVAEPDTNSEIDIYKHAVKLLEKNFGTFDECL